jgi:hypothetical protein
MTENRNLNETILESSHLFPSERHAPVEAVSFFLHHLLISKSSSLSSSGFNLCYSIYDVDLAPYPLH